MLRQIAFESYLPLIKLLKNRKNHKFTLNLPLSLLELMDKYGYKDWIGDVRALFESERVELTGSAAYHPLLTKLPQFMVEQEIALNEYGLGYYFGSKQGFEGQPSIMIKNVQGFFPPELAVNADLTNKLSDFNYNWFLAEESCLPRGVEKNQCVYGFDGMDIKMVCRDKGLSNLISFKRDTSVDDIISGVKSAQIENRPVVLALDGEYFGHHFKEGIYLLESMLDRLERMGVFIDTVSSVIDDSEPVTIEGMAESCWGASEEEFVRGDLYPFWVNQNNEVQNELWELQDKVLKDNKVLNETIKTDEYCNTPIWKNLECISDPVIKESVEKYILLHKFVHSDKFWWSSNKEILGKRLYHPGFVKSALALISHESEYRSEVKKIVELLS